MFPLAFHTYSSLTRYKYDLMLLCTAACLVCAVFAFPSWRRTWRVSPARILALLWFSTLVLSSFYGAYADTMNGDMRVTFFGAVRYEGLLSLGCYFLLFMIFSLVPQERSAALPAAALSLFLYVGITALQYLGYNPLGLFPEGRSTSTNYEFQGPIGNIDMVSGYLTLAIPLLVLTWVLGEKSASPAFALSGLLGVLLETMMEVQSGTIAMMVLCGILLGLYLHRSDVRTRAGLALGGMVLCLFLRSLVRLPWLDGGDSPELVFRPLSLLILLPAVLFPVLSGFWKGRVRKGTLWALTGLCLVLALVLVYVMPLSGEGALTEVHEMLHGHVEDTFGSWRVGVYRMTLDMSRGNLLLGTGPDTFYYAFRDYLVRTGSQVGEKFDNPHNLYLAFLTNTGLPSLVLYLSLVLYVLARCIRRREPFASALAGSLLLYSIQGFFSFSICLVSPMFYAILGMAAHEGEQAQEVLSYDPAR